MSFLCYICNKSYVNKNSLAAHKSRYHKRKEDSSNRVDGKDLPSAFGSVITPSRDVNRTRYRNNQDLSDEAENIMDSEKVKLMGKKLTKKRPVASEETSEDSDIDSKGGYKRRRSSNEIYSDSDLISGESAGEYINRVRRKQRKFNRNYERKKIARKLEQQNKDEKEESMRELTEQNKDEKEESITKLGNDESEEDEGNHTKQSIRDIECRGLVHEVILESIEKKAD